MPSGLCSAGLMGISFSMELGQCKRYALAFLLAGLFGFGFGDLWLAIMVQLLVVSQARDNVKTG
ncbi:hypothetical protein ACPDZV_001793 [Vibrio cholerae]|uniref:hypothetical protein n=1 Tax=Vibrio cholerae TaxID=666 RepID=UPI00036244D2|nr:hypothetical protein [Vibrio cholerae]